MNIVLITGASSGIGKEFAEIYAKNKANLLLVARSGDKLKQIAANLSSAYAIQADVFVKDLAEENAVEKLMSYINEKGYEVTDLINNAGFGDYGSIIETDWAKENSMIHVNVVTVVYLAKGIAKHMIDKNIKGKILNVGSIASFMPNAHMSIYHATKAFVLSFSLGIREDLKRKGITVTTLCPGVTASGFQERANITKASFIKGGSMPTSKEVAEFGYKHLQRGSAVAIHGFKNRFLVFIMRFLSKTFVTAVAYRMSSND
ncbi:SDR family oxidoreductase [Candidatus Dojkabacteria bacterium]|uniref:SDR family oxidoreductase n=1 Tax=Candidatus Dojkabacteria bacterium TaxID=2099670 RepID=A0A955RLW8_9BACT|nr:SDR family oxidoreductase [Candidatus Dojkabacteria bacterium]